MMKAATERAGPMQIMSGPANGRQILRARLESDQLLADFDSLLARHSMVADGLSEKGELPIDDTAATQPFPAADAAVPTIPNLDDLVAQLARAEPPATRKAVEPDGPEREAASESVDAEPASLEHGVDPPADAQSILVQNASFSAVPLPPVEPLAHEPAERKPASPLDAVGPKGHDSTPAVIPDEMPTILDDAPVRQAASAGREGHSPVVLTVASQETHFVPAPLFMVGDHGPEAIATAVSDPQHVPAQPAVPPLILPRSPGSPLKVLRVQLASELGPVNATMALKDDTLGLRIEALKDEAVMGLRENAGKLSEALQALGYSVDAVTVHKLGQADVVQAPGNGQPPQHGAAGQGGPGQGQWDPSGAQAGAEGSARQSRHTPGGGQSAEQDDNDEAQDSGSARARHDVFV